MTRPLLRNIEARRLFLGRHLLLGNGFGPGSGADLAGVLTDLGFVQVDSVNTLARSHDLIRSSVLARNGNLRTKPDLRCECEILLEVAARPECPPVAD
jgi:uncharacterized protein YcaQ